MAAQSAIRWIPIFGWTDIQIDRVVAAESVPGGARAVPNDKEWEKYG
jgi:hypothetical protein